LPVPRFGTKHSILVSAQAGNSRRESTTSLTSLPKPERRASCAMDSDMSVELRNDRGAKPAGSPSSCALKIDAVGPFGQQPADKRRAGATA
jgi:hypothetical protein